MFARHAVALAALVGLTACGGSGDGALAPTTFSSFNSLSSARYVYEPTDQTLIAVLPNGDLAELNVEQFAVAGLPEGFTSFQTRDEMGTLIYLWIAGQTPSEDGQVVFRIEANTTTAYQLDRFSPTNLPGPDAGTIGYSGSYAGQYNRVQSNGTQSFGHVFGTANMTVDFADSAVSGFITERERSDGLPATQVRLVTTDIVDGAFVGETRGGAFDDGFAAPGDYQGLIVGSQGQEIVGAVQFEFEFDGSDYTESGAMILSSD